MVGCNCCSPAHCETVVAAAAAAGAVLVTAARHSASSTHIYSSNEHNDAITYQDPAVSA